MARKYTDQEKANILQHLDDNYGNVTITSIQTGVPIRTIHRWKRLRKLMAIKNGDPIPGTLRHKKNLMPPPQNAATSKSSLRSGEDLGGDNDKPNNVYAQIREQMMEHLFTLMETLTDDPDTAHLRISALSRLLDRVIKLETLAGAQQEQVFRFEHMYPDGTIHDVPPWQSMMWVRKHFQLEDIPMEEFESLGEKIRDMPAETRQAIHDEIAEERMKRSNTPLPDFSDPFEEDTDTDPPKPFDIFA